MTPDKVLFRASSMGDILTGVAKGWDVEKSLTCKRKLVQMYREITYGRYPDKENKYTKKGNQAEEDAITLYSLVKGEMFKKNKQRLTNDYFTGELDLFVGEEITQATETIDTKCSWDLFTFPSLLDVKEKDYEYQGAVYMDLTGAKKHTVAYCLVNTPGNIITDSKRRKAWDMGVVLGGEEPEDYVEACKKIELDSIFDMELFKKHYPWFEFHTNLSEWKNDIPMEARVLEIVTIRDEVLIQSMKDRIDEAREWMNSNLFK